MNPALELKKISTFIFDIDGVLTDGTILVTEEGHQLRTMNIKDGYALQLAVTKGFNVIVVSGGSSSGSVKRLEALGITDVHIRVSSKLRLVEKLLEDRKLSLEEVLFMGDDMPDLELMQTVGLPVCPYDAAEDIRAVSHYISPKKGGEGCVRDVIEKVLRAHSKWMDTGSLEIVSK